MSTHIRQFITLLLLLTFALSNRTEAQNCIYPTQFVSFDSLDFTYNESNVNVYYNKDSLILDRFGNASTNKLSYRTEESKCEAFIIELMFKTLPKSQSIIILGSNKENEKSEVCPFHIRIDPREIILKTEYFTNKKRTTKKKSIKLDGTGILSSSYYFDQNWHHLVAAYDINEEKFFFYVDGKTSEQFNVSLSNCDKESILSFKGSVNKTNNKSVLFDEVALYHLTKFNAGDELYIVGHYDILNNQSGSYEFCSYKKKNNQAEIVQEYDPLEYPLNYDMGEDLEDVNDPIVQLKGFPTPRYKKGNKLHRNFPWVDYKYLGGIGINYAGKNNTELINTAINIQKELVDNWNYGLLVMTPKGKDYFSKAFNEFANDNVNIPAFYVLNWHFSKPNSLIPSLSKKPYIKSTSLRKEYYHLEKVGKSNKRFINAGINYEPIRIDGYAQLKIIERTLKGLTRPIDLINENGELAPLNSKHFLGSTTVPDSVVDRKYFFSSEVTRIRNTYKSALLSSPYLQNTSFSFYSIDGIGGHSGYKYKYNWEEIKTITYRSLSTPDFYPHSPYKWDVNSTFYHGMRWIEDGRRVELQSGDANFSPFVCAGWRNNPTRNMRPGQYLALLKALCVLGAEFYYSAFFNEVAPEYVIQNPKNYIWQLAIPSYAQAIGSYAEDILLNGNVLKDVKGDWAIGLKSNRTDAYNVVRYLNNSDGQGGKYLFTTSLQPRTNLRIVDTTESVVTIYGEGDFPSVTVPTSYAGRTYVMEVNESKPILLYCLDSWHEPIHPERWKKAIKLEAELYSEKRSNDLILETKKLENGQEFDIYMSDTLDLTSFVCYTSFINNDKKQKFSIGNLPALKYDFQPRFNSSGQGEQNVELRLRSIKEQCISKLSMAIVNSETGQYVYRNSFENKFTNDWKLYSANIPANVLADFTNYEIVLEFWDDQLEFDYLTIEQAKAKNSSSSIILIPLKTTTVDFEIKSNCENGLELITDSFQYDSTILCSYTISKSWLGSLRSGKKISNAVEHNKGKYFITGKEEHVEESWWNGSLSMPKFNLESYDLKKVYIKKEVFVGGNRIGKKKKKIAVNQAPIIELEISDSSICFGDSVEVSVFSKDSVSSYSFTPSLYLFSAPSEHVSLHPNKSGLIKIGVVSGNGCMVKDSFNVEVNEPSIDVDFSQHIQVCDGESGPVEIPLKISGGKEPYSIIWKEEGEIKQLLQKDDGYFLGEGSTKLTDQIIKLLISDQSGCEIKEYLFLEILDKEKCD